jgi:sortase A
MSSESEYLAALKKGVAHGKGTHFPGQGENIFLFSHSVSSPEYIKTYNAVFYDLKDLESGDEIIIYFSGQKFIYTVSEKVITTPGDISFLTKDYEGETLILQTCDPPGTTLRRLIVLAKKI